MNKMPATVDHNYPKNGNMLAVPERGTVTITILDNTGKSVGITQANKDGTWQRSFRLQDGKYTVKFTGIFRPLGTTPDGQLVSQPVKSDQRQIAITSPPTPPPQGATELRDHPVPVDHKVRRENQARLDQKDQRADQDHKGEQDCPEQPEQRDRQAYQVRVEQRDRPDHPVPVDHKDHKAMKGQQVRKGQPEHQHPIRG